MEDLIIGGIIIAFIIYVIIAIVKIVIMTFVFIFFNAIALADVFLGAMSPAKPALSWTLMGFIIGSVLYFAIIESRKLNRPGFRNMLIFLMLIFVIMSPLIGKGISSYLDNLVSNAEITTKEEQVSTQPVTVQASSPAVNDTSARQQEEKAPEFPGMYICTALQGVTVRSGPSTRFPITGFIHRGEKVNVLGMRESGTTSGKHYYQVSKEGGVEGYAWIGDHNDAFAVAH